MNDHLESILRALIDNVPVYAKGSDTRLTPQEVLVALTHFRPLEVGSPTITLLMNHGPTREEAQEREIPLPLTSLEGLASGTKVYVANPVITSKVEVAWFEVGGVPEESMLPYLKAGVLHLDAYVAAEHGRAMAAANKAAIKAARTQRGIRET